MTAHRDPDRLIHAFLMEGQTELADQVYDAVRATIEQKRQRAVIGPWRMPNMNKLVAFRPRRRRRGRGPRHRYQLLGPAAPGGAGAGSLGCAHGTSRRRSAAPSSTSSTEPPPPQTSTPSPMARACPARPSRRRPQAPTPSGWSGRPGWRHRAVGGTPRRPRSQASRPALVGGHRQGRLAPADRSLALRQQAAGVDCDGWLCIDRLGDIVPENFDARGVRDAGPPPDLAP